MLEDPKAASLLQDEFGGERYIKSFDGWHHLLTMLYAVILRFDSLREIEASMLAEIHKLRHIGLNHPTTQYIG